MKPRTELQKEVFEIAETMREVSNKHEDWALEKVVPHVGFRTIKDLVHCLMCGDKFQGNARRKQRCESCGRMLTVTLSRRRTDNFEGYMIILDVIEGFQIVRYVEIYCIMKAGKEADLRLLERMRFFYKGGKTTLYGQYVGMGGAWSSGMEIRDPRSGHYYHMYNPSLMNIYPERKVLKEFQMYGIRGKKNYYMPVEYMFNDLRHDRRLETLLKNNQESLLEAYCAHQNSDVDRYWPSVRIAIRHKYKVLDAPSWLDHLAMLDEIGKDLRNPKFICPAGFRKAHRELTAEYERVKAKKADSDLRYKNQQYQRAKNQFFGLSFKKDDIEVKVLESVEEFREEAKQMNHCVFGMRYYERKDSLILSARVKGERMETVEVDLKQMKVVQARGKNNKKTDYSDAIVQLVNSNIKEIERRVKAG